MTPAQRDLRDFIVDYQNANGGVSPTFRQMMDGVGYSSTSNIDRILCSLEQDGYIEREPKRHRAITVLPDRSLLSRFSTAELETELHSRNALARAA